MSFVKVKIRPPAGTIVLNRPEKRNALCRAMIGELCTALDDLHAERKVRGVILAGAGPVFCAGLDLAELRATSQTDREGALSQWHEDAQSLLSLLERIWRFPKIVIAGVHGAAFASGAALALAADIAVGASDITIGFNEPLHGLVGVGVAPLLAFRVGGACAARLILTGELIESAEALRLGILADVVPPDKVWAKAAQRVEESARGAPEAVQLSKRMLNEVVGEQVLTFLAAGAASAATSWTTEAAVEGLAAFAERRAPRWP